MALRPLFALSAVVQRKCHKPAGILRFFIR
jgi:hypothetical protein